MSPLPPTAIRVLLVETAPPDRPGSMLRYADLVEACFSDHPEVQVERVTVAPTAQSLQSWPARLRNLKHHGTISWKTRGLPRHYPHHLFHVTDGSHAYLTRWLPPDRTIVTTHDVIPLLQSLGKFPVPSPGRQARWLIRQSLKGLARSAGIVADSQGTAADIAQFGSISADKLRVVPLALPLTLQPAANATVTANQLRQNAEPFVFHIGNNGFYKNRTGVVRIFDLVRKQLPTPLRLKMAGPSLDASLRLLIQDLRIEHLVDLLIDIDDDQLIKLYQQARLFLFPSIYEGFGWPPLEAMAWGCPVVCTHAGSLAEVVGDAALVGDPADEQGLAQLCLKILDDPLLAQQQQSLGLQRATLFSIERLRADLLSVYHDVQARSHKRGHQ